MPALVSDESQEVKAGWPSSTLESRLLSSPGHAPPEKITPVSPILQKFRQQLQHPWWTALGFLSALALYLALQGPNSWLHLDTGHIWKAEHQTQERLSNELPTVHLCGDSTMAIEGVTVGDPSWGWGQFVHRFLNLPINNKALSGRSTRTYTSEGDWDRLKVAFRPGDIVIIEHGLNDEGDPSHDFKFQRNSLLDLENENATIEVLRYGRPDIVHTYQWYVKRWINDIRASGAIPILSSPIGTGQFDGPNAAYTGARHWYPILAERVAKEMQVHFVNHNKSQREYYSQEGRRKISRFYPTPGDVFHVSKEGADKIAELFFAALKCNPNTKAYKELEKHFSPRASSLQPWC